MTTGGGENSTASQFAELLSAIKGVESSVDEKLSQLCRELKDEHESADERLVKRMRIEKKPTFRKNTRNNTNSTRRCRKNWTPQMPLWSNDRRRWKKPGLFYKKVRS